jgi:hypothetical protein
MEGRGGREAQGVAASPPLKTNIQICFNLSTGRHRYVSGGKMGDADANTCA